MTTALSAERQAALIALTTTIRSRQNFALGLIGGALGAAVGAVAWAAISAATTFQIGYMAIGVGYLVGYGVRALGGGMAKTYGYAGAVLSLIGCLAGNFGALVAGDAHASHLPIGALLAGIDPLTIPATMVANFQVMDLVFYAIALSFGYKYSLRRLTKAEIATLPA